MKKALKTKWLKALRSGKYKQTRKGVLCNISVKGKPLSYCCLGVLCEVAGIPAVIKDFTSKCMEFDGDESYLTFKLNRQLGINLKDHDKLVDMNDTSHYNFKQIADWVSKNIKAA